MTTVAPYYTEFGSFTGEDVLLHHEPFRTAPEKLCCFHLVHFESQRVTGIEVFQAEILAVRDAERIRLLSFQASNMSLQGIARHRPLPPEH